MKAQAIHTVSGKVEVRHTSFLIPKGRLVKVNYWANGVRYSRNIPNPETNSRLQVALLAIHVSLSQVESVESVKEICPNGVNSENYVETYLARVKQNELTQ